MTQDTATAQNTQAFDWIAVVADRSGASLAQIDLASGRRFTYAEMHDRVGRFAAHLRSEGIGRGDRVAYLMRNSTDVFEVIFACWRLGAVAVALNWRLAAEELQFIIDDSSPRALVFDRELGPMARSLGPSSMSLRVETAADGRASEYEYAIGGAEPLQQMAERPLLGELGMLMYSSGTTGRPKGVMITHQMQLLNAWATVTDAGITPGSTSLCFMPLFHIAGVNGVIGPCFLAGAAVAIMRDFSPDQVLAAINDPQLGISHMVAVPAIYQALRMQPAAERTDFSSIRGAFVGASAVPGSLVKWWSERGLRLREGYGLTETAGAGITTPQQEAGSRPGVTGKVCHSFDLRIVRHDGSEAEVDEPGELWMRGPIVTPGYWNRPEANAAAFVDGWFRSGDIVSRDANGYYSVRDRLKDMYISGGENVFPAEVESALDSMPQIAETAVVGIPDERWGEVGCVAAVLKPGCELSIEEVREFLAPKLARFKLPVRLETFASLPRTASGKVQKQQLRQALDDLVPAR